MSKTVELDVDQLNAQLDRIAAAVVKVKRAHPDSPEVDEMLAVMVEGRKALMAKADKIAEDGGEVVQFAGECPPGICD